MGNRGGRFHTDAKTLTRRRWASRQWICCVLDFKGCRRVIWGRSYTELFFLDEPIAFAAGHRPCFECRRKDAEAFAEKWCEARRLRRPPYAAEMDEVLHAERLRERAKRLHRRHIDESDFGSGKVRHTTHHVRSLVGLGRSGHEHCRVVPPDAFCNHSTEKFCESIALAWKSLGH